VRGGTAVVVSAGDLDHANPLVTADRYTQEVLRFALLLPLLSYDEELSLRPALAEQWTVEGDTAVLFHIRRDVRWHDGVPTSAHDVAFTFARAADPRTAFPNTEWVSGWGAPVVLDSFTIRFPVEGTDPLATIPFLPIAPRHLLDSIPPERMRQAQYNHAPIGNGPFRFVEYHANDRWVFDANPDFPEALGGRPYLDRLVWRIVPDGTAETTELQTGNAHLALSLRAEQVVAAIKDTNLRLVLRESPQYGFVGWNGRRKPLNEVRVRQAFALALDRDEMIDVLRAGHGTLASGPIGRWHWAYDTALTPVPFAPDSARALLEAAGLRDRNDDGMREMADGKPLRLTLKVPAGSGYNRDLGEMIVADLRAVGIAMDLQPTEWSTMISDVTSPQRSFDAVLMGWETDFRLDMRSLFHSGQIDNPYQFAAYNNPEADSLLDVVADESDRDVARAAYQRLQQLLRDEQPWGFLYYYPDMYVAAPRLRGLDMDIRGRLVNLPRWWLAAQSAGADTK
jgi:peptide/nickel transport system substrate-binding protein